MYVVYGAKDLKIQDKHISVYFEMFAIQTCSHLSFDFYWLTQFSQTTGSWNMCHINKDRNMIFFVLLSSKTLRLIITSLTTTFKICFFYECVHFCSRKLDIKDISVFCLNFFLNFDRSGLETVLR